MSTIEKRHVETGDTVSSTLEPTMMDCLMREGAALHLSEPLTEKGCFLLVESLNKGYRSCIPLSRIGKAKTFSDIALLWRQFG